MCQNIVATTNIDTMQQSAIFLAWKHGHIVAAILSRAQLWINIPAVPFPG